MKEYKIRLYKFEELPDKSKQAVIDKYRYKIQEESMIYGYSTDWEHCLETFCKLVGITCHNWHVDPNGYSFDFYFHNLIGDMYNGLNPEHVTGKYLRRWLCNNFDIFKKHKTYWNTYTKDSDGKVTIFVSVNSKTRKSRIIYGDNIDCSLTGYCGDIALLEPLWKEWEQPSNNKSLDSLINECFDSFFAAWQLDWKYCGSDDFVAQELQMNQYENYRYFEDGQKYNGPNLEEVI